jgi:hypothetical protein
VLVAIRMRAIKYIDVWFIISTVRGKNNYYFIKSNKRMIYLNIINRSIPYYNGNIRTSLIQASNKAIKPSTC